jgi:molybdenum cofactor cytidylyltransferase
MSAEKLFTVVLAAGKSSRFGSLKQLQNYAGNSLAGRAVRLAEEVCGPRSILVTGKGWKEVSASCAPLRGFMVVNAEYEDGIASSISRGVRSVSSVADAVLLMLADQPLITQEHLQDLIGNWRDSPDSIVASAYAATSGPPVIFPRRDFAQLMALEGDQGARSIIKSSPDRVRLISFEEAALDVDRREDLPADY